MEGWADYCVAQIGASAALAGLVFVGITINLEDIMKTPSLPNFALGAVLALTTVLAECSVLLTPHQSRFQLGLTILLLALTFWAATIMLQRDTLRKTQPSDRRETVVLFVLGQVATLAFVLAGAWVLVFGEAGLSWFLPGTLLCYLVALTNAWVLLIEIKR